MKKIIAVRLVSGKVTAAGKKGTFLFVGRLTVKEHTKDISFPFAVEMEASGGYRFKGAFTMNRKDFDLGGTSTISDKLEVTLDVIAK
jgi:polyisoprenoid-binding protein YceI